MWQNIIFTPEEEAALDEVWDGIARESEAKRARAKRAPKSRAKRKRPVTQPSTPPTEPPDTAR